MVTSDGVIADRTSECLDQYPYFFPFPFSFLITIQYADLGKKMDRIGGCLVLSLCLATLGHTVSSSCVVRVIFLVYSGLYIPLLPPESAWGCCYYVCLGCKYVLSPVYGLVVFRYIWGQVSWFMSLPYPQVGAAGIGTNGLFVRGGNFYFMSFFLFVKFAWSHELGPVLSELHIKS